MNVVIAKATILQDIIVVVTKKYFVSLLGNKSVNMVGNMQMTYVIFVLVLILFFAVNTMMDTQALPEDFHYVFDKMHT